LSTQGGQKKKINSFLTIFIVRKKTKTMIETVEYKGEIYPAFQAKGFASEFAFPFALKVCEGKGFDIGCNRKEWALPGAIPIDPEIDKAYDALNLPCSGVDFIFSSHCLEHIPNWVQVLDHWRLHLRAGGVMFLYLPDFTQKYWRPWNNRKHVNAFTPEIIKSYFLENGFKKVFCSERDLNNSFMIFGEKI
jgi:SAM-dependent methyltransferase